MNPSEIKAIIESILFAAGTPVPLRRLAEVIGVTQAEVKTVMAPLLQEYAAAERGIRLAEVAGGYQFRTAAEYADYVKKFVQEKPSKLSRAALETLAIIAYRQPLTKAEVELVRGVDVDGVLNSLLTKKLIRVVGRKDVAGRPWVYGTTPQFLELFGLNDLSSLPPLPAIHEPTLNPFSEQDASRTFTENSEPSGDLLTPDSGDIDSIGTSAGEWRNGHASGDDSGPTA
ncbi:MAG: SMC-Scp complex subunit ScpB [Deltaproteobacteria bacterium]|nr:SMC-Scp complex subunit ScpB [Deltaproteobacteria bacterium]